MKEIKRRLVLDDFEYRLLVGCVNKARTMFIDEGKPVEDVSRRKKTGAMRSTR